MKIYLTGALFSAAEQAWNAGLAQVLRGWSHEVFVPQEHQTRDPLQQFETCKAGLDTSHVVVATLDGPDVDSGTAWEIGRAYTQGKPVFGIRTDLRAFSGAEAVNAMVLGSCQLFTSEDDCIRAVNQHILARADAYSEDAA